jgi:hypothetical protein
MPPRPCKIQAQWLTRDRARATWSWDAPRWPVRAGVHSAGVSCAEQTLVAQLISQFTSPVPASVRNKRILESACSPELVVAAPPQPGVQA